MINRYLKQKLIESLLNESRNRDWEHDPHNFGITPSMVPPGSFVSHGDIFDNSDVIWHHTEMLKHALKDNDEKEIERHSKAIKNAGGDPDSIISDHRK